MSREFLRKYMDIIQELNQSAELGEKWDEPTKVSPSERGKYQGRSVQSLRKEYNQLKSSGPHSRGSTEYGRMRELAFAIRAKTGWGSID